jgi:hypothetical protein
MYFPPICASISSYLEPKLVAKYVNMVTRPHPHPDYMHLSDAVEALELPLSSNQDTWGQCDKTRGPRFFSLLLVSSIPSCAFPPLFFLTRFAKRNLDRDHQAPPVPPSTIRVRTGPRLFSPLMSSLDCSSSLYQSQAILVTSNYAFTSPSYDHDHRD